jgi:fatty-acyl-CoA synthase
MSSAKATSYVCGGGEPPLIHRSVGGVLEDAAAQWPDNPALISCHQNIRWTYRELNDRADRIAAAFIALDLHPGERIGIWSPNNAEWVLTQFAAAKAGLILVTINPAYRLRELEYALNKVQCRALVLAESFKTSDYIQMLRELMSSAKLPHLRLAISLGATAPPGFLTFAALPTLAGADRRAQVECQPDDPINIQFTSGTTGSPKAATLTHSNIVNNGLQVAACLRLTNRDRLCIPVPLYHCFGMVMGVLGCATHGAAMVFPSASFDAERTLQAIAAERCTALYGVPTMYIAELNHPDFARYDLASLRTGIMSGAPCPIEVMRRVMHDMHMSEITCCYGMTEMSPVTFQCAVDDPIERRVSTVGRVHPHVEAKVIDPQGRTLPRGQSGELLTRGYSLMLGYWDDAERTREVIDPARWMHTGDLATIDADGYCNIVGRAKDMIIRGGENIYPREIEEFLYTHPKIQAAQVFGVPDPKYGEQVCAWIKLATGSECTAEDIIAFCRDQIAYYKIPHYIEFVDDFPMTVTGKAQKFLMREQMTQRLSLKGD